MFQFVDWLRVIAAVLITNAHYEDIYPISAIANGGLLGDVIFFALSGFCLNTCGRRFWPWYTKRLLRVYPPVWIISLVFVFLKVYWITETSGITYVFFYPTYYHFVGSILVLYVPFYFAANWVQADRERANRRLGALFAATAAAYGSILVFFYDLSYYHIDLVAEPMIRFLFWAAMLVGLYFKLNRDKYLHPAGKLWWMVLPALFAAYLATKLAWSRGVCPLELQWIPQIILIGLLGLLFRCVMGLEKPFAALPTLVKKPVHFIAGITLEIYLVQYGPILYLNKGPFPGNFLMVSAAIIVSARVLNWVNQKLLSMPNLLKG